MSDQVTAPVETTPAAPVPVAPVAAPTVADQQAAAAASRERFRERAIAAVTRAAETAPDATKAQPAPDGRADRLLRIVERENHARAEEDRVRSQRESLEAQAREIAEDRERVQRAREMRQSGNLRGALEIVTGGKISDEDYLQLIEHAASDEPAAPTVDQLVKQALEQELSARAQAAKAAEDARRAELDARDEAELRGSLGAYTGAIFDMFPGGNHEQKAAAFREQFPYLDEFVSVNEQTIQSRFEAKIRAGIPPEQLHPEALLRDWESEYRARAAKLNPAHAEPTPRVPFGAFNRASASVPPAPTKPTTPQERIDASRAAAMARLAAIAQQPRR